MDKFTLKGGIFLYALMDGNFTRATTDIDLLAQNISNDIQSMKEIFQKIFSMSVDDPLYYDLMTLNVVSTTEFKEYHGVNVSVMAYLNRTRIPVSIDIGFGDVIYPERVMLDFPTILGDEVPKIYAYSLASSIAEKFEAMVKLGYDNSRFKDFYDIYVLSGKYDFAGIILQEAIHETFKHRKTGYDDIVVFEPDYPDDTIRQSRWKAFAKKKKINIDVSLKDTIEEVKLFLEPVIDAIKSDDKYEMLWNHESRMWESE